MCGRGVRAGVMLRASEADLPDDWREQVARMSATRPPSPPKEG